MATNVNAKEDAHVEGLVHKETNSELVTRGGQVAADPEIKEPRRGSRKRTTNTLLQDFVCEVECGKHSLLLNQFSDPFPFLKSFWFSLIP